MNETPTPIAPNDLLLFARVVEAGSFSRAADRLGLPKSTVSRRIAALELALGERLLLRTTRKFALTEFGAGLLEHARQLAAEVDAAAAFAQHRQARPSGRLRISMPADFANLFLVDLLAAFSALHPAISLDLDLSPRRVDLVGENFDLALRMGDLPDDANLAARRVAEFPVGLYAAPAYLAERGTPSGPDDLLQHEALRLRGRDGEAQPWTLVSAGRRWEQVPPGRITANSPELRARLARGACGIVALADYFAAPHVQRRELLRILPDWCLPAATAWAVFPERRLMPAKTRAFLDMLTASCRPHGDGPREG